MIAAVRLALADEDGTLRCPDCRAEIAAQVPLVNVAGDPIPGDVPAVLVDGEHPAGDLVIARAKSGAWGVRRRTDGEHTVDVSGRRRREHRCPQLVHKCVTCGDPANLFPGGAFCAAHEPGVRNGPGAPHSVSGVPE